MAAEPDDIGKGWPSDACIGNVRGIGGALLAKLSCGPLGGCSAKLSYGPLGGSWAKFKLLAGSSADDIGNCEPLACGNELQCMSSSRPMSSSKLSSSGSKEGSMLFVQVDRGQISSNGLGIGTKPALRVPPPFTQATVV